jgi:hypothetical protein
MEKSAIFNDEINSGRVIANFRIEFNQRLYMPINFRLDMRTMIEEAKVELFKLNTFEDQVLEAVDENQEVFDCVNLFY